VQRYADVIEEIEGAKKYIAVASDLKLIDGKHRWLAYRKRYNGEDREIQVLIYPVTAPHDQLALAAELNSDHGWQLAEEDKEGVAKSLYAYGFSYESIAARLKVGKARVSEWLARTVKENKDKRDRKIFDMWMACCSFDEIAEACDCGKATVSEVCSEQFLKTKANKPEAQHAVDFERPIYNVWKQQEKSNGSEHFGNSEVRWVDNLLYLYTQPFDVVVDPFAGGGSTVDICKKRFRRYWVSDRKPVPERAHQIREHDLTDGLPKLPRWQDVKLVYLDPPYWKQAEGRGRCHFDAGCQRRVLRR
jgi:DNA-directed RNA polymerase specialized sigma24 family protein